MRTLQSTFYKLLSTNFYQLSLKDYSERNFYNSIIRLFDSNFNFKICC